MRCLSTLPFLTARATGFMERLPARQNSTRNARSTSLVACQDEGETGKEEREMQQRGRLVRGVFRAVRQNSTRNARSTPLVACKDEGEAGNGEREMQQRDDWLKGYLEQCARHVIYGLRH